MLSVEASTVAERQHEHDTALSLLVASYMH